MFENLIEKLKKNPTTLVFTEGTDARILEAASRLKKNGILEPLLIGVPEEVQAAAEKGGFDITDIRVIDPANYRRMDELVDKMVELRKGKMTPEECHAALLKGNYFGTMLVKMGVADALLGGATYSTADTVRPALQLVKTKPGNKSVSSSFVMIREKADGTEEKYIMATAPSISSPLPKRWPSARWSAPTRPEFSTSIPRWPCFPIPPRALARVRTWIRSAPPLSWPRAAAPELASTASCSLTPRSLPWWPRPSARALR